MISNEAIKRFLNRELDDFEWVKNLRSDDLNEFLNECYHPSLTDGLWTHQKIMLAIMAYQPRFVIFSGLGSGKTRTILTQLRQRKLSGEKPKAIILVPYITAVGTWIDETEKFAPELVCQPLLKTSSENLLTLKATEADLYPVCYQTSVAMFTDTVSVYNKRKDIYENKWIVNPEVVNEYTTGFDTLILDEVHRCKDPKTQNFILSSLISKKVERVYGLTGTPFGRDKQDLWAEFYLIDFGETLGPDFSFYRNVFFNKKKGFWGGMEYTFKARLTTKLREIIKNKSIHFKTEEMLDIPAKQYVPLKIRLSDTVRDHVAEALANLHKGIKDKNYKLVGNSFITLRQLSSGFLTFKVDEEDDNKERVKIKFKETPKLDALVSLVQELDEGVKMVVFHDYIFSGEMIHEALTKIKVGHARIWSGQRDQLGELKKFREDKSCKVLAINSKSGSSALNLQNASVIVFYECPPVIDRVQAEARCWRPGQTQKVIIYDLLVKDTLDEEYYTTVREGGDLLKQFLTGKRSQNG